MWKSFTWSSLTWSSRSFWVLKRFCVEWALDHLQTNGATLSDDIVVNRLVVQCHCYIYYISHEGLFILICVIINKDWNQMNHWITYHKKKKSEFFVWNSTIIIITLEMKQGAITLYTLLGYKLGVITTS
jgi:hypothetical protein